MRTSLRIICVSSVFWLPRKCVSQQPAKVVDFRTDISADFSARTVWAAHQGGRPRRLDLRMDSPRGAVTGQHLG